MSSSQNIVRLVTVVELQLVYDHRHRAGDMLPRECNVLEFFDNHFDFLCITGLLGSRGFWWFRHRNCFVKNVHFCCSFQFFGRIFTSSSNKCAYIATIEDDGRLTLNGARHSSPRNVFEDYSGNPRSAISSLPNSLKSGSKPSKDIIRHIIGINGFIPNLPDTKNYWFK